MNPKIYYRKSLTDKSELFSINKYFQSTDLLTNIRSGNLVIPRYSMFPFYLDQEREINNIGAKLINSYHQHQYVADLQNYVYDLKDFTPKTWDNLENLPDNTKFILKGETNSKKSNWLKMMFAENKQQAISIHSSLSEDSLISYQKIYIREYIPLKNFAIGIGGMPISNEFRIFVCYGKIIAKYYYWSNHLDEIGFDPDPEQIPISFLEKVIGIIGNNINFYCLDVAETTTGEWIVIELNDGIQAGIPDNSKSEVLYKNLFEITK